MHTRFVFVEGIMGAGKSTTVEFLCETLKDAVVAAVPLWEGPTLEEPDQPIRVSTSLVHPHAPWEDLSVGDYVATSLERWVAFVAHAKQTSSVTICDGLLFHGNLTDLLLMDAPPRILHAYAASVVRRLLPLHPSVIYLRREAVGQHLQRVVGQRGSAWMHYQVNWKVASPYGKRHSLRGLDGLIDLYTTYRDLCDSIFGELSVPNLLVEHSGDWTADYERMLIFLQSAHHG